MGYKFKLKLIGNPNLNDYRLCEVMTLYSISLSYAILKISVGISWGRKKNKNKNYEAILQMSKNTQMSLMTREPT